MSTNEPPKSEEVPNENDSEYYSESDAEYYSSSSESPEESDKKDPVIPKVPLTECKELLEATITCAMQCPRDHAWVEHGKKICWLDYGLQGGTHAYLYLRCKRKHTPCGPFHVTATSENLSRIREKVDKGEINAYKYKKGDALGMKNMRYGRLWTKFVVELECAKEKGGPLEKRKFTAIYQMQYSVDKWEVEDEGKGLICLVKKDPSAE